MFEVLAEPNRRRILDLLRETERPVGELVEALGLSQPAVSKHLKVLRDAGAVDVRVDAQRRLYRLRPESLQEIEQWLEPYRAGWRDRLESLDRHLDQMPDQAGEAHHAGEARGSRPRDARSGRRPPPDHVHPAPAAPTGEGVAGRDRA